jgi:hypothetical protein
MVAADAAQRRAAAATKLAREGREVRRGSMQAGGAACRPAEQEQQDQCRQHNSS